MQIPNDKILCQGRYYRYVVACMYNCPFPHFCDKFWEFFESRGLTPAEYYNVDGIGEKAMKRIVYDCDRCGRKAIREIYGLYCPGFEQKDEKLTLDKRAEAVIKLGYHEDFLIEFVYDVLEQLEKKRGWQHFCEKCFSRIVDSVASILNIRKVPNKEETEVVAVVQGKKRKKAKEKELIEVVETNRKAKRSKSRESRLLP